MRRWIFALLAVLCLSPALVRADDSTAMPIRNAVAEANYRRMVEQFLAGEPSPLSTNNFRAFYANTRQYDPIGTDAIARLQSLAAAVTESKGAADREQALADYKDFLHQHLANLDVVGAALVLARQNPGLGDAAFLSKMYQKLLDAVRFPGAGKTVLTAYQVITVGEEKAVLDGLNADILQTLRRHAGSIYYNIYDLRDRKTGRKYAIFVNITVPIDYLQWLDDHKKEHRFRWPPAPSP